jgi:SPP1 family predicted phage head-tail adaptor
MSTAIKHLCAGDLRHRVTIQSRGAPVQNPETGEVTTTWLDVASVWAAISPISGREFIASAAIQSAIVARITIRYRPGLDAAMRIVHVKDGQPVYYNPQAWLADADSGLEYLNAPCTQGLSDG